LAEDSFERISGSAPALMPDHKGKFAIMESTLTVQECALCRTKVLNLFGIFADL
jgi:hypothetical protein